MQLHGSGDIFTHDALATAEHGVEQAAELAAGSLHLEALRRFAEDTQSSLPALLLAALGLLLVRYTRDDGVLSVQVALAPPPYAGSAHYVPTASMRELDLPLHASMSVREAVSLVARQLAAAFPLVDFRHDAEMFSVRWHDGHEGMLSATFHVRDAIRGEFHPDGLGNLLPPTLRLEQHWRLLLQTLAEQADMPLALVSFMDDDEQHLVRRAWRASELLPELARPACLQHLFEAQAAAHPARIAVQCGEQTLSYRELNRRADQLAQYLRARGIGRGSFVAIFLPRSAEVFVTLLAVLKAGAAYVPIDPDYPADRVDYILRDCGAGALVTTTALSAELPAPACPVICLEREAQAIARTCDTPITTDTPTPDDIAYVIYTSGSTGRPKGVLISHRAVAHLVRAEAHLFHVKPSDRVYQGFSIAFDAAVEEVWLAFHAGATLVAATREMAYAGPDLARLLRVAQITVFSCVPTLLALLDEDIPTVRLLILGGEACPPELVARWAKPGRRVVNTYGPTEATVIATCAECHPGEPITIGRPIPNYAVYILDERGQATPIGVAGELHIGGVGLARGYVHAPQLTAERFIANPYAGDAGAPPLLYKTGDLVRYTAEGDIEFLGRIDAQVKLRGFRIELSEIESVLLQHPAVQSAVVDVRDAEGLQQLVAYLIPNGEGAVHEAELRAHLHERLPNYMIPTAYVLMTNFPTLSSGKLDRRRLPAPLHVPDLPSCADAEVHGTPLEMTILAVWRRLFALQTVTLQDDFFELGGHSLLAARMISTLRENSHLQDVALLDLYRHPVLADFAAALEARRSAPTATEDARAAEPASAAFHPASRRSFYACALGQAASLYALLGIGMLVLLFSYHLFMRMVEHGDGPLLALLGATVATLAFFPLALLLALGAKWILLGRMQPGAHPVWGWYYWRFWLVRCLLGMAPLGYLRGTPFLGWYYRLLGARIGRRVYLGTHQMAVFDLLTIGEESSIGAEVEMPGYTVEHGQLILGPVTLGRRCYVGAKAVLHNGAVLEDDAALGELSMLPAGTTVPRGEHWRGSPARRAAESVVAPVQESARPSSRWRTLGSLLFYLCAVLVILPAVLLLAVLPGAIALFNLSTAHDFALALLCTPLCAAAFVVLLALEIALAKALLLHRVTPGQYRLDGSLFHRKWLVDTLMHMGLELLHPLYATLYLPPWFRLLGARLGKRVEISTVTYITPELLTIDRESFIADSACLGASRVYRGWLTLGPISIGARTFVGNSALVPTGTAIGDESLIGCLSVPPAAAQLTAHPHDAWLGSPAIRLPRRQPSASFPDDVIYRPPWYLYLLRGSIEFFRVTLPSALSMVLIMLTLAGLLAVERSMPLGAEIAVLPGIYLFAALATVLVVISIKWLVVGRYHPCVRPLWSSYVWRNELITALHESFCAPLLLNMLLGTPFLSAYFRLMGARIGKRVFWNTTQLTEFDQVEIADDVALNHNCTLQTHLFEDRVMKTSTLRVLDRANIGTLAVVLYDTEMKEDTALGGLSLLMKGETLPAGTRWEGIPARSAEATGEE